MFSFSMHRATPAEVSRSRQALPAPGADRFLLYPYLHVLFILVFSACSGLKLDTETNCLNDKASCFKADKTRPRVVAFTTQPPLDITNSLSELQYIDVTFSEEIKDGESAQTYRFKPSANYNFSVISVQRQSTYTYRLLVGGSLQNTGLVELDIAPLQDYNQNLMDTIMPVAFNGNVNIPIVSSVNHNGVSTAGGYASVDLKFYHNYTADVTNANSYQVRLTSGAVDCNGGTLLTSGSNLAPGVANEITWNVPAASFASGMNRLVVCISNANNPNAANSASWPIIRDDVAPVLTYTPAGGSYKDPQAITLTCNNNADKIAYTSSSQQSAVPADPAAPTFDPSGNVLTGNLYTGSLTAQNPANPTYTKFLWRCIDIAGNLSTALVTPVQFYIDNTIPGVTVNLASGYRQYVSTVNPSTTLTFSTDQVSKTYNIRRNGTTCDGGGDGMLLTTGTTPATAGDPTPPIVLDITSHFTATNTTYPVRICVAGTGIQWGTAYLEITRDDTVPTITPSVVSGSYGALQSVEFTCDDSFGSVHRIAYSTTEADGLAVPAAPASPVFNTATGDITTGSEQTGPLSPPDRKTSRYAFRCIDRAGNVSAVGNTQYTIDATLPVVHFVSLSRTAVSGNAGAYADTTFTFTSNRADLTYRIRRVANCDHAGTPAETIAVGTVTAANTNIAIVLPNAAFPTDGQTYPLRACVYNFVGASSHQVASVSVTRDNSYPTFAGLTSLSPGAAGEFTLNWSAATDTGSNVAAYNIYRADSASGPWITVHHVATHPATSITVTVPNPLQTYYFVAGAVDNAGNETKVTVSPLSTKPEVRLIVSGLGSGKSFTFADGTGATAVINSNHVAPGTLFATSLALGQTYALQISVQPEGQVCSIIPRQFGTLNADLAVNISCVDGVMVAGRFQDVPAAPLASMLYRTSAVVQASSYSGGSLGNTNSIAVVGNGIFFGSDLDCETGAGVSYCLYRVPILGGSVTAPLAGLPGVIRGMASDGSNLYYTMLSPENKLYKYAIGGAPIEIASGFTNPFGIALDYDYAYVADRGANAIVRVDLRTGNKSSIVTGLPAGPLALVVVGNELYFTLDSRHAIYRAPKTGGSVTIVAGDAINPGHIDHTGIGARLNSPHDLLYDGYDNIYFTEYDGHYVRRLRLSTGRVTTLAGDGTDGLYTNGTGPTTRLSKPVGIGSDGRRLFIGLHGIDKRIVRLEEAGLRGYWPLNANTRLRDYNGAYATVNDMAFMSGSWVTSTGRYGDNNALKFDATRLQASSALAAGSACNVSTAVWFNANNPASGSTQVVFHNGDTSSSGYGIILGSNGEIGMLFGGAGIVMSGIKAQANQWTHAATICYGNHLWTLYINGHPAVRGDGSASQKPNSTSISEIVLGANNSGGENFAGAISEMRLYDRILTEGEINELAQDAAAAQVGASYNTAATDLLVHYNFSGATSGTSVGNQGALAPLALTASSPAPAVLTTLDKDGEINGAYSFSTSDSYSSTSTTGLPLSNAPRTLCAWVQPFSYPPSLANKNFFRYGTGSNGNFGLFMYNASGSQRVGIVTITNDYIDPQFALPLYTWSHLCATYDGSNASVYVNGQVVGSITGYATNTQTGPLSIFGDGMAIDDVRIYNSALTNNQIRQLAVQVPVGLVARFDLNGDTQDVSGWGHNATTQQISGSLPALAIDRFGLSGSSYAFAGTQTTGGYLESPTTYFPVNTQNRTVCAWFKVTASASYDQGIFAYGASTTDNALGFSYRDNGLINFFGWNNDLPTENDNYNEVGVWHHLCGVWDGSIKRIYQNGAEVRSWGLSSWDTTAGTPFYMGRILDGRYFTGSIDDVRIYNRPLSANEVRALVTQPNKRMQLSATTVQGNFGGAMAADALCPTGYKALLNHTDVRRACTTGDCSSGLQENLHWVMRPFITYLRSDGQTPIATANDRGIFSFPLWNSITGGSEHYWTGMADDWTSAAQCGIPVYWSVSMSGTNGIYGRADAINNGFVYNYSPPSNSCSESKHILCVEQ